MAYPQVKRPVSATALIVLEVFYAIMGTASGLMLILDPSGVSMGITPDIRDKIPFESFLLVGMFLFFIYGLGSITLAYGSMTRKEGILGSVSRAGGYHWSWVGGILMTVTLVIWLIIEGSLIGLDWAATYFTVMIGAAIFVMLILPPTRKYYRNG
ncbi:MAG: hypothetical protein WC375_04820 [Methanomassiliicoccales archaeon]|jgi:hypothetical protein